MLLKQPAQVFVPGTPGQAYVPEQHVCTPTDAPPGSEAPGNWVMSCYEEYRPIASAGTGQYSYGTFLRQEGAFLVYRVCTSVWVPA